MAERRGRPLKGQRRAGHFLPPQSPGGSAGCAPLLGGGAEMEAEGGGEGRRQPDRRRNFMPPAAPGAHRPFNGAGPGGEGAPPLPCQVVSPGGGAAAGSGGARRRPRAGRGGARQRWAWSGPRGRGAGAAGQPRGWGTPGDWAFGTPFRLFPKSSGVFADAVWRFPLGGLARTVTSLRLPSGSWNL